MEHELVGLVSILTIGIAAQWIAWRLHLPAILLLLLSGVVAGPITGLIDPDALFGELLLPGVSLAVAVILFEGGLSLRLSELGEARRVVLRLCTVGALVTWALATIGAQRILSLDFELALIFGAILIVTGPTVILPMLRQLRLSQPAASVLKWEGILIDPVGALIAVIVFETLTAGTSGGAGLAALASSFAAGTGLGVAAALGLGWLLGRYHVPDHLQSPVVLASVAAVTLLSNAVEKESGVLAATVMGMALGAQKNAPTRDILEFKENLRVLLISSLFVVLAARLDLAELRSLALPGLGFVAWLALVVRPATVLVSTVGTSMPWRHRIVLMALAPRGIVAAAVASLFALHLAHVDSIDGSNLISLTFVVIVGTILVYSVAAPVAARTLGVANQNPQGVLIIGAQSWSRDLARALVDLGVKVQIIDEHLMAVRRARMESLPAEAASIASEHLPDELDLDGIGYVLAMTPDDHSNALAAVHLAEVFGRANVYQLAAEQGDVFRRGRDAPPHLSGRTLFRNDATASDIARRYSEGAEIRRTSLTEAFDFRAYRDRYGDDGLGLVVVSDDKKVAVFTASEVPRTQPGDTLIGLVLDRSAENGAEGFGEAP